MLEIKNASVEVKGKKILEDVSLTFVSGEIFGLLGPNGSGKSTTLSLISGLMSPNQGLVSWVSDVARQGLSVVFQTPSLDKRLTVDQNLKLTCRLFGIPSDLAETLVSQELEKAGLSDQRNKKVLVLSGGLKRRVDLVRALLSGPTVLLLDEPTSGLDEASFFRFWDYLMSTQRQGTSGEPLSVILATHNPREAERCSRVAVFSQGKVLEVATPSALKQRLSSDVIILKMRDVFSAQETEEKLSKSHGKSVLRKGSEIHLDTNEGAKLIPRIVESLDRSHIDEISLKRASMSDVFLRITGQELSH